MRYNVLLQPGDDPGIYVAFVPSLDIVTQGASMEQALDAAREAIVLTVRGLIEEGEDVPADSAEAMLTSVDVPLASENRASTVA